MANNSPLRLTALQANSIVTLAKYGNFDDSNLYYRTNNTTWLKFNCGTKITLINTGDYVQFQNRSNVFSTSYKDYGQFNLTGNIKGSGNTQSLLNYSDSCTDYCFYRLFCTCESLTESPQLPATNLATKCYKSMFYGCTALTTSPQLPATNLADECYNGMFEYCVNLTTPPQLPATTLAIGCYSNMFWGCTSIITAPQLPATNLATACYAYMFERCTALTTPPQLPATTLACRCYYGMFSQCSNLITAPQLPATTLAQNCYVGMFYKCTNLNSITSNFTDWDTESTFRWVCGVANNGTFNKPQQLQTIKGIDHIPQLWNVKTQR